MHSLDSVVPAAAVAIKAEAGTPTRIAGFFKTRTITNFRNGRPRPRSDEQGSPRSAVWVAALFLTGALSACADYRPDEPCGKGGCSADRNITANVRGSFAQHPELQGPDQLYVNTRDHVVYLSGIVETGLHRDIAASAAREVTGVTSVVNNIAIDK